MESYSILDEISKSKNYDIALMTTFNFEINFLERFILNRLHDNNIKKVSIFVDSDELNKSLLEISGSHLGKKYMINPIKINGAFHPKLILLLGENKAKLIIGSSNITTAGYTLNNEIFNSFEYTPENNSNLTIINDAINFFIGLNDKSYKLDNNLFNEIRKLIYYKKNVPNNCNMYFINNLYESIISQVSKIIKEQVIEVDIAVPYYDNKLEALSKIKDIYKKAKINLYIQNEKSNFPLEYNNFNNIVNKKNINVFKKIEENNSSNFYHGKVIRFITNDGSYILYGSANCTKSALIKSQNENGNIECDILEKGTTNEYDYFFDNFLTEPDQELKSNLMEYKSEASNNFYFKYGISEFSLILHIGYANKFDKIKVTTNQQELKFNYLDNELLVYIPLNILDSLTDIFSIEINYESKIEEIRCWYYDINIITSNRLKATDNVLFNILANSNYNFENIDYIKDAEKLIKAMFMNKTELDEYSSILATYFNLDKKEENDQTNEEEDSFIVDVAIPDEYVIKYREFEIVKKVRRLFVNHYLKELNEIYNRIKNNTIVDSAKKSHITRPATTDEKSFESLIKSRIKSMLDDNYIKAIEFKHLLENISVVLDIFDKYNNIEKVAGIFSSEYVITTKIVLLKELLSKQIEELTDEERNATIIVTLISILENHYLNYTQETKNYKIELENKKILEEINKLFNIRNNYADYLRVAVEKIKSHQYEIEYDISKKYIEELFGFKTQSKLLEYIKSIYGEDSIISFNNAVLTINVCVDDISKHMRENINILKEIKAYSNNINKIDFVLITINNNYINNKFPDPLIRIIYQVNLNNCEVNKTYYRKSGTKVVDNYKTKLF